MSFQIEEKKKTYYDDEKMSYQKVFKLQKDVPQEQKEEIKPVSIILVN